ncbi:scaffolding protein [Microbacterium phage OscarSo]|uniref:Scaffolding protein n=1 Tax=Microbacterium phage OscarSo TaxID=2985324 RepID=A0A9X9K2X7_9CAUD|nr:scaffolding protein [Microbacterium phage OscarSo]UYL87136.1 scaffolding protein [Microbacterium phage OscarSo]
MARMADFLTYPDPEPRMPLYAMSFAKSASGGGGSDDEDDDDDDDEDDDEDDDDDLADLSEEELRAELKKTRTSLSKVNGQSMKRRKLLRERERELEEARKPKPKAKKDGDDDSPDLDTIRHEARAEGEKAGITRAKKAEARASLLAAGVNPERATKAIGLLDLDELDLDDDGLDGIDEAIEDLRKSWPELFAKKRTKREPVGGERGGSDDDRAERRGKAKTASEIAAERILRRAS